ncbi:signal peptidase I [Pseudofulvibacter geojedonensis]|uniref:Signal peptidase I n=1 Tax=Pseudofulvibacter geojedonensis TaxID=1123758 RepID=A0ABW3I2R0_9FLAO
MSLTNWFIVFLIIQVIHFLGTWKLYIKAGRKAWEAAVPVYNAVVLMKIINRPKEWYWVILLFVPIVNVLMFPIVWVETCRSFRKNTYTDTALAVLTGGFYIYYLNYFVDVRYKENRSLKPISSSGEWTSSILFAVIAATLVHTYFMQPFVIPTSSLEKTLLKGDFLFVSKFHYGARLPMTAVAAPMVHDTLPIVKTKSYIADDLNKDGWRNKLQFPYMRIPGFQNIKRNDIVVFNWPADSSYNMGVNNPDRKYLKPIDKKTNYVKRCVGLPGDHLEVRDGYVFINGKQNELPERAKPQFYYIVTSKKFLSDKYLAEDIGTTEYNIFYKLSKEKNQRYQFSNALPFPGDPNSILVELPSVYASQVRQNPDFQATDRYAINLSNEEAEKLKKNPAIKSIERRILPKGTRGNQIFPKNPNFKWNGDNYGPIQIPKEGESIDINIENLPLYKKAITDYEGNTLQTKGSDIYINGEKATSYTFKQNYYWMMGDNRQNSLDARSFGFTPFNHVVGKPVFVWMSISGVEKGFGNIANWKFNWDRIFTTVNGSGKPKSYFSYFIIALVLWQGFRFYRKKKKKNKEEEL